MPRTKKEKKASTATGPVGKHGRVLRADNKERRKPHYDSFKTGISKLVHDVYPDGGMSSEGAAILDSIVKDLTMRVAEEASTFAIKGKRNTILNGDVTAAFRILIDDPTLAKATVDAAGGAVTRLMASKA